MTKAWVPTAGLAVRITTRSPDRESDQVYLDLLTGWRDAWQLGVTARDNALAVLSEAVGGSSGQEAGDPDLKTRRGVERPWRTVETTLSPCTWTLRSPARYSTATAMRFPCLSSTTAPP